MTKKDQAKELKGKLADLWKQVADKSLSEIKTKTEHDKKELEKLGKKWAKYCVDNKPHLRESYEVALEAYLAAIAREDVDMIWRKIREGLERSIPIIIKWGLGNLVINVVKCI